MFQIKRLETGCAKNRVEQ